MLSSAPSPTLAVDAASAKPVVLFQASGIKHRAVREWLPVAEAIRADGCDPVFIVDRHCSAAWLTRCDQAGIRYRVLEDTETKPSVLMEGLGSQARFAVEKLMAHRHAVKRLVPFSAWVSAWVSLRNTIASASELIAHERPRAIVLHLDSVFGLPTALTKVANRLGIPTLVVPLATPPPQAGLVVRKQSPTFAEQLSLEPLGNRLAARLFPELVHKCDGVRMLYQPVPYAMAAKVLGLMPRIPYSVAGGEATRVAAASERAKGILIADGVATEKIVVTGRPEFDELFRNLQRGPALRRELCQALGVEARKKLVLYSLAHWAEHGIFTWEQHWRETAFVLERLAALPDAQVVVSLPPACRYEDYEPLASRYRVVIVRNQGISELMPCCDLFVSGTSSSTVALAVGCCTPAVVIEFYGFEYSTFEYGGGVVVVRSREEFVRVLERLITDEAFAVGLAEAQTRIAAEWILLDGQCAARIAHEVTCLVRRAHGASEAMRELQPIAEGRR